LFIHPKIKRWLILKIDISTDFIFSQSLLLSGKQCQAKVKGVWHLSYKTTRIVIYTTREKGKAFVHANCMFVHEAQRKTEFQLRVSERQ
jgi:hypothetical protein